MSERARSEDYEEAKTEKLTNVSETQNLVNDAIG